jgi:hypothetical protein
MKSPFNIFIFRKKVFLKKIFVLDECSGFRRRRLTFLIRKATFL